MKNIKDCVDLIFTASSPITGNRRTRWEGILFSKDWLTKYNIARVLANEAKELLVCEYLTYILSTKGITEESVGYSVYHSIHFNKIYDEETKLIEQIKNTKCSITLGEGSIKLLKELDVWHFFENCQEALYQ